MARSPENACHGKVRYESKAQAADWARTMAGSRLYRDPSQIRTYRCPFCGNYHLGNAKGHTRVAKSFGSKVFTKRSPR